MGLFSGIGLIWAVGGLDFSGILGVWGYGIVLCFAVFFHLVGN